MHSEIKEWVQKLHQIWSTSPNINIVVYSSKNTLIAKDFNRELAQLGENKPNNLNLVIGSMLLGYHIAYSVLVCRHIKIFSVETKLIPCSLIKLIKQDYLNPRWSISNCDYSDFKETINSHREEKRQPGLSLNDQINNILKVANDYFNKHPIHFSNTNLTRTKNPIKNEIEAKASSDANSTYEKGGSKKPKSNLCDYKSIRESGKLNNSIMTI